MKFKTVQFIFIFGVAFEFSALRSRDKEGCGGAVWTDLEVPAGIDRKVHVETCRVDEHMAYID
ncbi:hypothetical protein T06_11794 [Trichinella sp. T6]|nr:hypothetical protein T06_11794 [Trichinella sp. T6]